MIDPNILITLPPQQRNHIILSNISNLNSFDEIDQAREIAKVINSFIEEYFQLLIENDDNRQNGSILKSNNLREAFKNEIDLFKPIATQKIQNSMPTEQALLASAKNLYEMSGATKLAFGNRVTRNLSTTMGLLWERLASISPYAINPEKEFNLKVKGIDLISLNINTKNIEYQQLKTQQNTLTGSQKGRSVQELIIHDNPVFCACLANKSPWTFNHPDIPRISGADFWERIGIPYHIFLESLKKLVLELEDEYVKILEK